MPSEVFECARTELDGARSERGDRAAGEEGVAALRAGPAHGGEQRREARAARPQQRTRRPRARGAAAAGAAAAAAGGLHSGQQSNLRAGWRLENACVREPLSGSSGRVMRLIPVCNRWWARGQCSDLLVN